MTGVNKDLQVLSEVSAAVTWKATGSSDLSNFWASAVEQQDNVGGDTKTKGNGTAHNANGDLSYFSWEGTSKAVPKESGAFDLTGSGTFTWLGGTGKYQKLSGRTAIFFAPRRQKLKNNSITETTPGPRSVCQF